MYYYKLGALTIMFVSFTCYCLYKKKTNEIIELNKRFDDTVMAKTARKISKFE